MRPQKFSMSLHIFGASFLTKFLLCILTSRYLSSSPFSSSRHLPPVYQVTQLACGASTVFQSHIQSLPVRGTQLLHLQHQHQSPRIGQRHLITLIGLFKATITNQVLLAWSRHRVAQCFSTRCILLCPMIEMALARLLQRRKRWRQMVV